jgi:hypothetical protein
MQKWRISNAFLKLLSYATKINPLIVVWAILGILVAALITLNLTKEATKIPFPQPLNSPPPPPVKPVLARTKLSPRKASANTAPLPRPNWAVMNSLPIPYRQPAKEDSQVVYNLNKPPKFKHSQELQAIINDVVQLVAAKNLPDERLSITLIDAKTDEIAGYQQDTPRYPASVVKMFWMVILYAQIENDIWASEKDFTPYIAKMIGKSDNEAASYILDLITGAYSESELNSTKLKIWKNKRQQVNRFFQNAGYKGINISQKTYPIDYLHLTEPKGSELQWIGNPIWNWNKITSRQAARLLYEICYAQQAVSPFTSRKMCAWLKKDLNSKTWQKQPPDSNEFNPVRSFFGESLSDTHVRFYSKAGWTSFHRAEVAMIAKDNSAHTYILAIFAADSAYADDVDIFPQISRQVHKRMTSGKSR